MQQHLLLCINKTDVAITTMLHNSQVLFLFLFLFLFLHTLALVFGSFSGLYNFGNPSAGGKDPL